MSKIRQGKFKPNYKEINISEKLDNIYDFFKDDMRFKEIDYDLKVQETLEK